MFKNNNQRNVLAQPFSLYNELTYVLCLLPMIWLIVMTIVQSKRKTLPNFALRKQAYPDYPTYDTTIGKGLFVCVIPLIFVYLPLLTSKIFLILLTSFTIVFMIAIVRGVSLPYTCLWLCSLPDALIVLATRTRYPQLTPSEAQLNAMHSPSRPANNTGAAESSVLVSPLKSTVGTTGVGVDVGHIDTLLIDPNTGFDNTVATTPTQPQPPLAQLTKLQQSLSTSLSSLLYAPEPPLPPTNPAQTHSVAEVSEVVCAVVECKVHVKHSSSTHASDYIQDNRVDSYSVNKRPTHTNTDRDSGVGAGVVGEKNEYDLLVKVDWSDETESKTKNQQNPKNQNIQAKDESVLSGVWSWISSLIIPNPISPVSGPSKPSSPSPITPSGLCFTEVFVLEFHPRTGLTVDQKQAVFAVDGKLCFVEQYWLECRDLYAKYHRNSVHNNNSATAIVDGVHYKVPQETVLNLNLNIKCYMYTVVGTHTHVNVPSQHQCYVYTRKCNYVSNARLRDSVVTIGKMSNGLYLYTHINAFIRHINNTHTHTHTENDSHELSLKDVLPVVSLWELTTQLQPQDDLSQTLYSSLVTQNITRALANLALRFGAVKTLRRLSGNLNIARSAEVGSLLCEVANCMLTCNTPHTADYCNNDDSITPAWPIVSSVSQLSSDSYNLFSRVRQDSAKTVDRIDHTVRFSNVVKTVSPFPSLFSSKPESLDSVSSSMPITLSLALSEFLEVRAVCADILVLTYRSIASTPKTSMLNDVDRTCENMSLSDWVKSGALLSLAKYVLNYNQLISHKPTQSTNSNASNMSLSLKNIVNASGSDVNVVVGALVEILLAYYVQYSLTSNLNIDLYDANNRIEFSNDIYINKNTNLLSLHHQDMDNTRYTLAIALLSFLNTGTHKPKSSLNEAIVTPLSVSVNSGLSQLESQTSIKVYGRLLIQDIVEVADVVALCNDIVNTGDVVPVATKVLPVNVASNAPQQQARSPSMPQQSIPASSSSSSLFPSAAHTNRRSLSPVVMNPLSSSSSSSLPPVQAHTATIRVHHSPTQHVSSTSHNNNNNSVDDTLHMQYNQPTQSQSQPQSLVSSLSSSSLPSPSMSLGSMSPLSPIQPRISPNLPFPAHNIPVPQIPAMAPPPVFKPISANSTVVRSSSDRKPAVKSNASATASVNAGEPALRRSSRRQD